MSVDQYFTQEWKPISTAGAKIEETYVCFDCNICLDFAHDPVVTLCGHLYCWPCIYKWCYVQSASLASNENPQCPVCKAEIYHSTVVPLYGRGHSPSADENEIKPRQLGILIPPRPSGYGSHLMSTYNTAQQFPYHNNYQNQQEPPHSIDRNEEDSSYPLFNLWGSAAGMFHPVMGMFGEMVYARTFGNSDSLYSYPNSYHSSGRSSTRLRRQEMQADKSLNRISIFLFCCFLLCLLLF